MNYTVAILFILLLVTFLGPTRQDKVSTNEQFEELPSGVKADLFTQMNLFVLYRRQHKWVELYDLFWKPNLRDGNSLVQTKDQFIALQSKEKPIYEIENFQPLLVQLMGKGADGTSVVRIEGCGEFSGLGRKSEPNKKLKAGLEAYLQNRKWFFTNVGMLTCSDCQPKSCNSE